MQVDWFLVTLAAIAAFVVGYGLLMMPRGKRDKKGDRADPAK
ncbi:MAG TPA: hypothetical protein VJ891_00315 [Casimicrobiaceae bacterium]|nr:hypothetical protein [Casimicrobiaceae bacterium]